MALIGLCVSAFAQELEFGLKAGLSQSKISLSNTQSIQMGSEPNSTFNFGAYGRFKVILIGLYVQPELIVNRRACNFTVMANGKNELFSHSASYIDVPVLVGFKMLKLFRIYGGPNFQFMTKQKTDLPSVVGFEKSDLTKKTTGIQLGVGLDLAKFRIDAKYDFNNSSMGSPFIYNGVAPTMKSNLFTVQVGFKLFGIL